MMRTRSTTIAAARRVASVTLVGLVALLADPGEPHAETNVRGLRARIFIAPPGIGAPLDVLELGELLAGLWREDSSSAHRAPIARVATVLDRGNAVLVHRDRAEDRWERKHENGHVPENGPANANLAWAGVQVSW